QQLAADFQHRPLDHRWLRQHQRQRLFLVEAFLVGVGQLLERRAGAIEQRLPARLATPLLQLLLRLTRCLVVQKIVSVAMRINPGGGVLHGVAVLDAVDGGGQGPFLVAASTVASWISRCTKLWFTPQYWHHLPEICETEKYPCTSLTTPRRP